MSSTAELIHRYFELAAQPDPNPYLAQFSADAVLEDEGGEHHGTAAIRTWRSRATPVTYIVNDMTTKTPGQDVHVEIAGGFPGSPVLLTHHFTFTDDGHITMLTIRPSPDVTACHT